MLRVCLGEEVCFTHWMSIVSKLMKAGVINKVLNEAKKPENQEKAKKQFANAQSKYKSWKSKKNR